MIAGMLKNAAHCFPLYKEKEEEREILNHFAQDLVIMETRDFMDVFSLCLPELFDFITTNSQLLHVFSALLQIHKVIRPFADVLINYLVNNKMETLKQPDTPAAKLVLQLFRFIFLTASKASTECERVLQPHVSVIMDICMKNAPEVEKPLGYMHLMRSMFRSLSTVKFDTLMRDLIPTLQPCLTMLLAMLDGPMGEDMKDLILDLCLTLPARLSSLLPHIPRLMKPLVLALKGNDDLVSLALRTLDFWIESLNPDFLELSMAGAMSDIILSLWAHLRPPPYPWGTKALHLLGKLGGRNRRFLKEPLALECKDNPEHGLRLILTFEPSTPFLVPLDRFINFAIAAVMGGGAAGGMDIFYRKQALKFISVCLASYLNLKGNITDGLSRDVLGTLLMSAVDPSRRRVDATDVKVTFRACSLLLQFYCYLSFMCCS
jgi:transformation/transcription domain-associated protein